MCTVSYLPKGENGFIITSTRDEKLRRKAALKPALYHRFGQDLFYPRDEQAFGTWFAASRRGFTLCLLNGGFRIHTPQPPYRKSRGLVLLDFFEYNDVKRYRDEYDFIGIEPFTLLLLNDKGAVMLDELRWDGNKIHHREVGSDDPGIWSSVTLYTDEVIEKRNKLFREWLDTSPDFTQENILRFHKTAGTGDIRNDILMNRDEQVLTVSITSVMRSGTRSLMVYEDMINSDISCIELD